MPTVLIVDDSSSMTRDARWQEVRPAPVPAWRPLRRRRLTFCGSSQARAALAALADIAAKYDADGIDVFFLNSHKQGLGMTVSAPLRRSRPRIVASRT